MRIQVINGGPLSGWLTREGYLITNKDPDYTIECVPTDHNYIAISTGNIELENLLIEKLRELGEKTFLIDKSPPLSDRKLTIKVPTDCNSDVERGIFRAFVMYLLKNSVIIAPIEPKPEVPPVPWYKRLFPLQLAIAFLSLTVDTNAQDGMTFIRLWTSSGPVDAADFANNAMRVNVVAGAGSGGTASTFGAAFPATGTAAGFISSTGTMAGANLDGSGNLEVNCLVGCSGSSFADSTPLTFGVTSVSVFAAVVDDTGTNTVAENSAGAPRMNTNRILYSMNTNSTGTEVGTAGAPIRTDPTGTTIQPVSAASLPLPTGAATSALQLPDGHNVTVDNAAGAAAVNIQDGGNIITVDGTVAVTGSLTDAQLRATPVPISGTVTANQGTAAASTAGWPVIGGNLAITSTAWTSATGLNTTLRVTTTGYRAITVTLNQGSTVTGGIVTFEASDTTAFTNAYPIQCDQTDVSISTQSYNLEQSLNRAYTCDIKSFVAFQVRLSTVIVGSGTINVGIAGSTMSTSLDRASNDKFVEGVISAACAGACPSPETANSTVKLNISGTSGGIYINFPVTTLTGTTLQCEGSGDGKDWILNSCLNLINGNRATPTSASFSNPVALEPFTPNITPGQNWIRVRATVYGTGSITVRITATNNNNYATALPHTSWPRIAFAGGLGVQVSQRVDSMGMADVENQTCGFLADQPCTDRVWGRRTGTIGNEPAPIVRPTSARAPSATLNVACADPGTACAANSTAAIALGGQFAPGFQLVSHTGTPSLTVRFDFSRDSTNGIDGNWANSATLNDSFVAANGAVGWVNPTAPAAYNLTGIAPGATWARVRLHAFTSGSVTFMPVASTVISPPGYSYIRPHSFTAPLASVSIGGGFNVTAPTYTDTQMTQTQYTNRGDLKVAQKTSTLMVVAKSAANAIVTATLPAPGAGLFHYITWLRIVRMCTTAITGTAVLDVTTTNLATSVTFSTGNACAVGSTNPVVESNFSSPMQSTTANTATTIVCPAIGAAGICKIEVMYYTGS